MFMNNIVLLAICLIAIVLISGCVVPDQNQVVNKVKNSTSSSLKDMSNKLIDKFVEDFFNPLLENNTNSTS